jgi:putative transposase
MCDLAGVSRAGFYRFPPAGRGEEDLELRDAMQRIALEFPSYGWPRMTKELQRRGWAVNHKRVYRLMGEDNLLCLRKRRFIVTTDSHHPFPIYPNLAASMKLTNVNQLWVADITYIRLLLEFVYVAVILDAFSRRGVGWALGRTLETELTLRALRMALQRRRRWLGVECKPFLLLTVVSVRMISSCPTTTPMPPKFTPGSATRPKKRRLNDAARIERLFIDGI